MQKRLLKTGEAAEYLSIGRSTLCEWLHQGKVPSLKIGKSRLFDIKELDEFEQKIKTGYLKRYSQNVKSANTGAIFG